MNRTQQLIKQYNRTKTRLARLWREDLRGRFSPKSIVILTTSRSGSTWLADLITHSLRSGELPEHLRPQHLNHQQPEQDVKRIVERVMLDIRTDILGKYVGGTKVIWDNVPGLGFLATPEGAYNALFPILSLDPVIIHLQRRDKVQQGISRFIASQTGVYHNRQKAKTTTPAAPNEHPTSHLTYDQEKIKHNVGILNRAEQNLEAFLKSANLDHVHIVFEDLEQNPTDALRRIIRAAIPSISAGEARARAEKAIAINTLAPTRSTINSEWRRAFAQE